jgi:hypothetical protein
MLGAHLLVWIGGIGAGVCLLLSLGIIFWPKPQTSGAAQSVTSHNQSGGVTAADVTVPKPPPQ